MTGKSVNRIASVLMSASLANGAYNDLDEVGIEEMKSPQTVLPYLDHSQAPLANHTRIEILPQQTRKTLHGSVSNPVVVMASGGPTFDVVPCTKERLAIQQERELPGISRTLAYVEEQRKMVTQIDDDNSKAIATTSLSEIAAYGSEPILNHHHQGKEVHFRTSADIRKSIQSAPEARSHLQQRFDQKNDQKKSSNDEFNRKQHHRCHHHCHHHGKGYRCHRHRAKDEQESAKVRTQIDPIAPLQNDLHLRDKRFSSMVEGCINDDHVIKPRVVESTKRGAPSSNSSQRERAPMPKIIRASRMDSIMGFDQMRPQDLVYGEGSKVDGGFGYVLPSRFREGTVLLDSGPDRMSNEFSSDEARLGGDTSIFSDYSGDQEACQSESTISSFFNRMKKPRSLSDRVNHGNTRPSRLNIKKAQIGKPVSQTKLRESISVDSEDDEKKWDNVKLDTADAVKVKDGKPQRPSRKGDALSISTVSSMDDKSDRKKMSKRSYYQKDGPHYSTEHEPQGLSQADIVAICLIQGMVPPGLPPDPTLVTWSTPLSPTNPRNWSPFHKWSTCILVSVATFLANAGTNMLAPALGLISKTYHEVYTPSIRGLVIGCYVLAFAIAPLIFGPMSEVLGRKPVLLTGCAFFFIFTLASGFVSGSHQMMIFRFITALGASAPMTIGGAVITDIFPPDQRGSAMTVFALAPQLGPVLGPVMGGFVSQELQNWRYIFYVKAIAIFVCCSPILFIRESYTPRILAKRADKLRKKTGDTSLSTIFERRKETIGQIFMRGSIRPLILFASEPIIQMICGYVSVIYGVIHLLVATFPAVMGTVYAEYPGWASLHFIGVGIGTISGGIVGGYLMALHSRRMTERNHNIPRPEYKLFSLLYITWLAPLGLAGYFFITYFGIHWIFADLCIVTFCFGISAAVVSLQSYIVDCYSLLAGSALTSTIVVRSIFGFGATVGAEGLLLHAGLFWSGVALASLCVVTCVPIVFFVYFYGAKLRARSKYATHKR